MTVNAKRVASASVCRSSFGRARHSLRISRFASTRFISSPVRFRCGLSSAHCFAYGNLGKHQWTATFYRCQQHFSRGLPFWSLMCGFRQFLHVFAGSAQGAEHTAIRQRDGHMESARPGHSVAVPEKQQAADKAERENDGQERPRHGPDYSTRQAPLRGLSRRLCDHLER